jgi:hypothetical protein
MSRGNERRLRLFRLFSANLAIHAPHLSGYFVCPICAHLFREADVLAGPTLSVNYGHIFPEELGGNRTVLECCRCNGQLNTAGDNELIRQHQQWKALQSDGAPVSATIQMASGQVDVELSRAGFHAHWRRAHPAAIKELRAVFERRDVFTISLPPVDGEKIELAHLHTAHLLFFHEFGYAYLFTPTGWYLRELLHGARPITNPFLRVEIPTDSAVDRSMLFRIGVCTMPDGEKCLFASLPSPNPNVVCQFLLLPGPWDMNTTAYQRVMRYERTWVHKMNFRTVDRRIREHLTAPEYRNAFAHAWEGSEACNVDMTKLMSAIRKAANEQTTRRIDAEPIAKRLGVQRTLDMHVHFLVTRGFLARTPRRDHRYLVQLTEKATATRI